MCSENVSMKKNQTIIIHLNVAYIILLIPSVKKDRLLEELFFHSTCSELSTILRFLHHITLQSHSNT